MSEKHPGPLVVEGKLTDAERMKHESNYLRGTIAEDLNDGLTGGFKSDNFLLIRSTACISRMTATSAPNVLNRSWSRATRCCFAVVCRVG